MFGGQLQGKWTLSASPETLGRMDSPLYIFAARYVDIGMHRRVRGCKDQRGDVKYTQIRTYIPIGQCTEVRLEHNYESDPEVAYQLFIRLQQTASATAVRLVTAVDRVGLAHHGPLDWGYSRTRISISMFPKAQCRRTDQARVSP